MWRKVQKSRDSFIYFCWLVVLVFLVTVPSGSSVSTCGDLEYLNYGSKSGDIVVFFTHGLGDSAKPWKMFAKAINSQLPTPLKKRIRWVLPNAPIHPKMGIQGWYVLNPSDESYDDEEGQAKSSLKLQGLLDYFIDTKGIKPENVYLTGFSQGAVISTLAALTYKNHRVGGVATISGYLPKRRKFPSFVKSKNKSIPFLVVHGELDDRIKVHHAKRTVELMKSANINNVKYHQLKKLGHDVDARVVSLVASFLQSLIK